MGSRSLPRHLSRRGARGPQPTGSSYTMELTRWTLRKRSGGPNVLLWLRTARSVRQPMNSSRAIRPAGVTRSTASNGEIRSKRMLIPCSAIFPSPRSTQGWRFKPRSDLDRETRDGKPVRGRIEMVLVHVALRRQHDLLFLRRRHPRRQHERHGHARRRQRPSPRHRQPQPVRSRPLAGQPRRLSAGEQEMTVAIGSFSGL